MKIVVKNQIIFELYRKNIRIKPKIPPRFCIWKTKENFCKASPISEISWKCTQHKDLSI